MLWWTSSKARGAVAIEANSQGIFLRTKFFHNYAGANGGAAAFHANSPGNVDPSLVKDCLLRHNKAFGTGGAIHITIGVTTVHVDTSVLDYNYAGDTSGGILGSNDAILVSDHSIIS